MVFSLCYYTLFAAIRTVSQDYAMERAQLNNFDNFTVRCHNGAAFFLGGVDVAGDVAPSARISIFMGQFSFLGKWATKKALPTGG